MKRAIYTMGLCVAICGFLCGCVNNIDNPEENIEVGTTPIVFSIQTEQSKTRLVNKQFAEGDQMGLYATVGDESLSGNRYIDNVKMTSIDGAKVSLSQELFYPYGGYKLNFWSYYPYRSNALGKGKTTMEISVSTDQRSSEGLSQSYFLTSSVSDVEESQDVVTLPFTHKFAKIVLSLTPATGTDPQELLDKGITATAINFCTSADYDFSTGQFSNPTKKKNIRIHENWKVVDNSIAGAFFLIVPQEVNGQSFVLDIGGSQQTISTTMTGSIEAGKQIKIQTNLDKDSPTYLKGMVTSITDWVAGDDVSGSGSVNQKVIHLETLNFEKYKSYRIYQGGVAISEICKEYLYVKDQLDIQAIVHYPMANQVADLTKGKVLKVYGKEDENIHMGTVSWDVNTNVPTYAQGSLPCAEELYFTASGELAKTSNDGVTVQAMAYMISDKRGSIIQTYPVVKIGTQYWLTEDLRATQYTDGTNMRQYTSPSGQPGYLKSAQVPGHCFYTGEAVLTGKLAPSGCRIPREADWNQLIQYIGQNRMEVLKNGPWEPLDGVAEPNNKSGMNIQPKGMFAAGTNTLTSYQKFAIYWMDGETPGTLTTTTPVLSISYKSNVPDTSKPGWSSDKKFFHGLSVRCLVER